LSLNSGLVGAVLSLSLLGWIGPASFADEGQAVEATSSEVLDGLSTDLLETSPVEPPAERLIPAAEISTEEIPEEILRTEIITGARSPLTGEPLTAAEYAQLQEALDNPVSPNRVSDDIRYLVFLLQLRRAVRPILPFF